MNGGGLVVCGGSHGGTPWASVWDVDRLGKRLEPAMPHARELNLDGLIGPTHHYAGLAAGNLASREHALSESNPRRAALQGLAKMKMLADMGVEQAVLPPLERPDWGFLWAMGFGGAGGVGEMGTQRAKPQAAGAAHVLAEAYRESPALLAAAFSASSMWAANAATVCPSADASDGRVHFTPANLTASLHRSIEPAQTARLLRAIFPEGERFIHHSPLPASMQVRDEGAANHMRFCRAAGETGVQVFVYGAEAEEARAKPQAMPGRHEEPGAEAPGLSAAARFVGRQTLEASLAVARLHRLGSDRVFFVRQSRAAIDAGVFHNDVIALSHERLLLFHERAYADSPGLLGGLKRAVVEHCGVELKVVEVLEKELPLTEAVSTYFFNSQIVTLMDGSLAMICPEECRQSETVRRLAERLVSDCVVGSLHFVDVRESMKNGGGPACLRLRVELTDAELAAMHQGVRLTGSLYTRLTDWVTRHYRERLHVSDLADIHLAEESRLALEELRAILGLGQS
jgi:succinylarginine dihydrolase